MSELIAVKTGRLIPYGFFVVSHNPRIPSSASTCLLIKVCPNRALGITNRSVRRAPNLAKSRIRIAIERVAYTLIG